MTKLLSFWDIMRRFHAAHFAHALRDLAVVKLALGGAIPPKTDKQREQAAQILHEDLSKLESALGDVPISTASGLLLRQLRDLLDAGATKKPKLRAKFDTLLSQFMLSLIVELEQQTYLALDQDAVRLFVPSEPLFGQAVLDRFPEAAHDISSAGRCLALDEWTAVVFHLMRVLEIGLRDLARRLNIQFPNIDLEYQEWHVIIEKIEAEIKKVGAALPRRTHIKAETLEFYNRAAGQFWHFKDAWRNNVSHAHTSYDQRKAKEVYAAVESLMRQLAEHA